MKLSVLCARDQFHALEINSHIAQSGVQSFANDFSRFSFEPGSGRVADADQIRSLLDDLCLANRKAIKNRHKIGPIHCAAVAIAQQVASSAFEASP